MYLEVNLPRVRQAVGEMQPDTMRQVLANQPPEHAKLREEVLEKLTLEIMPGHLRAAHVKQQIERGERVVDPIPSMTPDVARALVAFFKRPHENAAWIPVWKDFEHIKKRANEGR